MLYVRVGLLFALAAVLCFVLVLSDVGIVPGEEDMFPTRFRPRSQELKRVFEECGIAKSAVELPSEAYRRYLGADEVLYRKIVGSAEFEIYVARWSAGNPFAFEATRHPPDVCWSRTGWKCERAQSGVEIYAGLRPAEWRLFSGENKLQEVAFWAILDGGNKKALFDSSLQVSDEIAVKSIFRESVFLKAWYRSIMSGSLKISDLAVATIPGVTRDSYFVRINSEQSMGFIVQSREFAQIENFLRAIGLIKGGGMLD